VEALIVNQEIDIMKVRRIMDPSLYFRSLTLPYQVLKRLDRGEYGAQIAKEIGITKQGVQHYITKLSGYNFIESEFRGTFKAWKLTKEGRTFLRFAKHTSKAISLGTTKPLLPRTTRLHALNVKFPILKEKDGVPWTQEVKLTNWIQKSRPADWDPRIEISLVKKTKCVVACFHTLKSTKPLFISEFMGKIVQGTFYIYAYLNNRGITVDPFNAKIISQHIANESPEYENGVDKTLTVSKKLHRKVGGPFLSDLEAKAWIDRSEGMLEVETNDLIYEEKLLEMPETLYDLKTDLIPIMEDFAKNIRLHLEVQRQTLKTLKKIEDRL